MANYNTLKTSIEAVIKQNGNNEITGPILQQSLLAMINSLGANYQYVGIATPATNPGTPDQNVFYIASTAGTYTNFSGLVLDDGEIAILKYNGAWSKDSTGAASAAQLNQLGQKVVEKTDKKKITAESGIEILPVSMLQGYPKNNGTFFPSSGFRCGVFDVSKCSAIVVYNNNVNIANFSILFSTDATFQNITHGFALYDGVGVWTKISVPDGALYAAADTIDTLGKMCFPELNKVGENTNSILEIAKTLPNAYSPLQSIGTIVGYPSTITGKINPLSAFSSRVYDVTDYNGVIIKHHCTASAYGIALTITQDIANADGICIRMLNYDSVDGTTQYQFVDVRGVKYLTVDSEINIGVYNIETYDSNLSELPQKINEIDERFIKLGESVFDSLISGCYPRIDTKTLHQLPSFNTEVYDVTGVKFISITCAGVNVTYYGIAFSNNNTTFDATSVWKSYPGTGTYSGTFIIEVPDGVAFMAIDKATTKEVIYYSHDSEILVELQNDVRILDKMFVDGFYGKKCIYIGDSISTGNNYHWKGFVLSKYNVDYVRESSVNISPANGGIPVIPPETEPESDTQKSIWYRCAGNRMAYFAFDFISLFGGTNDMNVNSESDLSLGTVNDTPFVDTLTGFSEEKAAELTATRPATLTFAAALMGCIEMLHRDFPDKTIVLCTVMPCYGGTSYGNLVDANGVRLSERMAQLQMQIAARYNGDISTYASTCDYGVIAAPMYWNIRTYEGAKTNVLSKDGVHPNKACGKRMADFFAKVIDLR